MTLRITPQPGIMDIALYVGGKSALAGHDEVLKLSSNENPLGAPPSAQLALAEAAKFLHRYPPTDHAALRQAIGDVHGLDPARIICGVGSDEVLQFVCQAFSGPGDEIIYTEHGFSMYPVLIHMAGATPVCVPETERRVDVDAILAGVTDKTRIVLLTNPGNPTGTILPEGELERLAEALPETVLLVIDGAYTEYAEGYDGGARLAGERPNVIMTRTFSKIYGLGGLRIGWGYGPQELIEVLTRIRQPFNLSGVQLAAAEAAVRDRDWVETCAALNAQQRVRLVGALHQLGIACDDSQTNFVLARFADGAEAEAVDQWLQADGIIVRRVSGYGFPEGLRITLGDEEQTGRVIAALTKWKEGV
ncbi:histidinol-phosphate transaminase [Pseudodonghicola xiamenensis]|uniref:Histidinol-phosphate aminotransferase n=1 Tax=Pseudodonghicola xiamenensis TaxID=337702 RepID=A0A8J3MD55_9RHOB|nr:histidinol-phosphate transaminase [Pseudodonghicola xiamenensis]GHG93405.1 histidinol-phosphate aminotransferase [Pseudodonghicola xiamenensis]